MVRVHLPGQTELYIKDTGNENKRNGRGKYTWSNGDTYDGEWKNNQPNGEGILILTNGTKYKGGL